MSIEMAQRPEGFTFDVVVVGGAGHVGLPLAIAFASRGLQVCIYDINEKSVATDSSWIRLIWWTLRVNW